jgi:hypothetical protein
MSNKENLVASKILTGISKSPGLLWEKLEIFQDKLKKVNGCLTHNVGEEQSKGLKEVAPLEHHFEGGLYTRELFMPKGVFIVSLIHKKQHPSFLLEGEVSFITDEGELKRIKAPYKVFTQIGTQRVFYVHKDSRWCCVNKTNATTVKEAELDIYVNKYLELPKEVLNKNKELCQQ